MARIAFVQNMAFEYLGVMYISAMLKKHGHVVQAFIVNYREEKAIKEIYDFEPDLAGFPCMTGAHRWALKFSGKIKERMSCLVIFGGPHPTYFPEIINESEVDIICRSEGEHAMLEIADKIDKGQDLSDTMNCWFKRGGEVIRNDLRPLIKDFNELPFPDRELYIKKYPYLKRSQKAFIGGRGCPFDCTFCFNHALTKLYKDKGNMVRYRSVDNVIAEINAVKKRYHLRTVYMQDDTLILNKAWVAEFARKYKREVGLPFICLIRADLADEETIRSLKEAGCKSVFFGIEAGSERLRGFLLKKNITDNQLRKTVAILRKHGLKFRTYNILGLPGETLEDAFKTVAINVEIRTDYPWCSLFHPFPGTELAEYAREKGFIDHSLDPSATSFFKNSIIKLEHKNEIVNLQKLFFYAVKFPKFLPVIKRLIRLRPNIIFDFAFLAGYGWCYFFSENLTLKEIVSIGMRNVKFFLFDRRD